MLDSSVSNVVRDSIQNSVRVPVSVSVLDSVRDLLPKVKS